MSSDGTFGQLGRLVGVIEHLAPEVVRTVEPFEGFFRAQFPGLVRFAALLGAEDPADLAQEAFVRLHARRHRLDDEAAALPYLRRTVVNLHHSRLRHLRVVRRENARAELAHVRSAEETVLEQLGQQRLQEALRTLSPRHRTILVLRYWLDLSGPEIAETLAIPLGTVKSQTSRALAALSDRLGDPS